MKSVDIQVVVGDIAQQEVDAVVNPAHPDLKGGGGVDGSIHSAAGHELAIACNQLSPCPEGESRITPGFLLPAKHVIHTVCPTYSGTLDSLNSLKHCHTSALGLAVQSGCSSLAFPAIGTGHNHFPPDIAASIAVRSVFNFLQNQETKLTVYFVLREEDYIAHYYLDKLDELKRSE